MPTIITRGAGSAQGLGYASSSAEATFIEDVFSTYLVKPTTSNTTYSVTNGIDVSGEGGMVWMKARSAASTNNLVYDTVRGASSIANNALITNSTSAQQTLYYDYITGLSNGFTVNFSSGGGQLTNNGIDYASWTFRKQPKFFDVVTYTGTGANRTIAHNLGSVPGAIWVKRTDTTGDWQCYHRSLANTQYMVLNSTAAVATGATRWNSTTPTDTVFSLGTEATVNASGGTYVAYLFAHDAGGFGLTGTDNVISCGSYTNDAGGNPTTVNLGYEPQMVIFKRTDSDTFGNWYMIDNMRGFIDPTGSSWLWANATNAEQTGINFAPTATGFTTSFVSSATFIYIAIRRGPMKVPTSGTSVFSPVAYTGTGSARTLTGVGFASDLTIIKPRATFTTNDWTTTTRLASTGNGSNGGNFLKTNSTDAETVPVGYGIVLNTTMDGFYTPNGADLFNNTGDTYILEAFRRAPGFFDVVCYTGTGSAIARNHNLTVLPELIITKARTDVGGQMNWYVGHYGLNQYATSISTAAVNNTSLSTFAPVTTTTFVPLLNTNTGTFVSYLFATVAGVSKVGSYTGTGTTQTIDCGFTSGARFVLIKRTDAAGDWYVWDSARGIVAGNDPFLWLNSAAAENTSTDYVDTASSGFEISSTAPAAINANGGSFIFLSIA